MTSNPITIAGETLTDADIPKCEYFRYHNALPETEVAGWWFDLSQMNSAIRDEEGDLCDGPFLTLAGDWMPIIAAVARCYFLDKLDEAFEASSFSMESDDPECRAYRASAEKWARIGRAK